MGEKSRARSDAAPRCRSCTQRARATTMMEVMKNMLAGRERSNDDEGGLEQAKRELTELHRIMQSLEQEAKVFEGVYLPLDELKRSLEEGKEQEAIRQGLVNTSLELASAYDRIRCMYTDGFAKQMTQAETYELQRLLSNTVITTNKYLAYLLSNMAQTPTCISDGDYGLVYDVIEADYPTVHEWLDVALNGTGYLNMIQDCPQFAFDENQKAMLKFAYGILSRMEELLATLVNCCCTYDKTLGVLYKAYLEPTNAGQQNGAQNQEAQDVQNVLRDVTRIQESLLGGIPYKGSATQGELLGLLALKVMFYACSWMHTELHSHTVVLSKDGRKGLPLLGPWQSAGAVTHVAHVSNKVRTQDLLIKTKDALKETQKQEEENGGKEGKGSSRGLEPA